MKMNEYARYRYILAEQDLEVLDDPYFNQLSKFNQERIEKRHTNYILEKEDDDETKNIVNTMIKKAKKAKKANKTSK